MKPDPPTLRGVRRGGEADELAFVLTDGSVLLAHAHGIHADEQQRSRERLLTVLTDAVTAGR